MEKHQFRVKAKAVWEKIESDLDDRRGFDFRAMDRDILEEFRDTQIRIIKKALRDVYGLGAMK